MNEERENDSRASACSIPLDSIICGDNCEVMRQWPDECIDLVVTSPPYDDLRTYGGHEWDFEGIAEQLTRCLQPGGVIVWVVGDATVNGSETLTSMRQAIHFKDACGLNVHDTMIYAKAGVGMAGSNLAYPQAWEYMFVLSKCRPKSINRLRDIKARGHAGSLVRASRTKKDGSKKREVRKTVKNEMGLRGNVWTYGFNSINNENIKHPAPYQLELAKDHITSWSNPGDIVVDPFAGSGTTLKAAKELNRRFIGIEVNPEYVEMCENRTAQEVLPLFEANTQSPPTR